jgi:hypothetical protein
MTVADILINYKVNPVKISYKSKMAVRESLKNAVGMYVRDWALSEQGQKEKLNRKPSVKTEERSRREYLLMRKMLAHLGREFYAQNPDTNDSQERLEKYLADYKTNLRKDQKSTFTVITYWRLERPMKVWRAKIDFVAFHTQ